MAKSKLKHHMLFGSRIDSVTRDEVLDKCEQMLNSKSAHHIVTPNVEMIVRQRNNPYFHDILTRSSLAIPDGVGVVWAIRFLTGDAHIEKIGGADLAQSLYEYCATNGKRMLLVGNSLGLEPKSAQKAAKNLTEIHSGLKVDSIDNNPNAELKHKLGNYDVVLVGFGAPLQDEWIDEHRDAFKPGSIIMGAGGTIDFAAGVQKRAPLWMQDNGFEWLWRLLHQPTRLKRQLVLPLFILMVMAAKLKLLPNALR